jgi:hypothetical protein
MVLIENKFNGSFEYTTVHKRSMEGTCNKIMANSSISVYSPLELPMDHPSWAKFIAHQAPFPFAMPLDFIQATQKLNNRSDQSIFLMHDGDLVLGEYKLSSQRVIESAEIDTQLFPMFVTLESRLYLDIFIAILGDFFIANPRSTFSHVINVVRGALGFKTVPTFKLIDPKGNTTSYLISNRTDWVHNFDIDDASYQLRKKLKV